MSKSALIPVLASLLLGSLSSGSTALELTFEQVSQRAERVIAGEVTAIAADVEDDGLIYSIVTIAVERALPKTLEGGEYRFRMVGGETADRRLFISGMPRLAVGERVALFLESETSTVFGPTVGLWQGLFRIAETPGGGGAVLDASRRPIHNVRQGRLIRGAPLDKGAALKMQGGATPLSLEAFLDAAAAVRRRR